MQKLLLSGLLLLVLVACSSSLNSEDLYGEWKYIKILNVENPAESTPAAEIDLQSPSIRFTRNNDLVIMWGGKQLSHGKFRVEGKIIRYTESLAGGTSREFPFLISKLNEEEIVFETMESEATRVTARRVR